MESTVPAASTSTDSVIHASESPNSAPSHPNSSAEASQPNGPTPPGAPLPTPPASSIAFRQLPTSASSSSSTTQPRNENPDNLSPKEDLVAEVTQLRKDLKDVYSVVHTLPKLLVVIKDLQERANQLEKVVFSLNASLNVGNTNTQLQQLQLQAQIQLLQYLQQLTPQVQQAQQAQAQAQQTQQTQQAQQAQQTQQTQQALQAQQAQLAQQAQQAQQQLLQQQHQQQMQQQLQHHLQQQMQQQLLQQQQQTPQQQHASGILPSPLPAIAGSTGTPVQILPGTMSGLTSPIFSTPVKPVPISHARNHSDNHEEPGTERPKPELSSSAASLLLSSNATKFQEGVTELPHHHHHHRRQGSSENKVIPLDPANPPNELLNLIIEMKRILKMEPNIFEGKPSTVAEKALKDFSPQIEAVQRRFGFLRREIDRFCSTKIRIWINNNKMRGQKALQSQLTPSLSSAADMEEAEMSADTESQTPLEPKHDGDPEGEVKKRKLDEDVQLQPSAFRIDTFMPNAQLQSVERTEGH